MILARVQCVLCKRGLRYAVKRQEDAVFGLLAIGWVLLNRNIEAFVCPRHNPATLEFGKESNAQANAVRQ